MPTAAHPGDGADTAIPRMLDLYGGRIYGLGLRLCGSPEDAEELVQETFLRAFRKWEQFEGRSDPSTWLYAIAARVCQRRRRLRSGQPRHMESLSTLLPSGEEGVIDIPATGETPLELLERREMRDALEQAITQLPPSFRLPLILKDLLELSVEEVAEVLGLKEATVKTRVHRARLRVAREVTKRLPRASAPPPDHARRVCLDLLRVKMEALDRGASFPVAPEELCQRCRSLFDSLDLARNTCRRISLGEMPDSVRQAVLEEMGRARHEVNVRA